MNSNSVRRGSKSPNRAYTGARIDPQELGVKAGNCYKCNSKDHRANDPNCPYANQRLTEKCSRCHQGGHDPNLCMRQKSGNG